MKDELKDFMEQNRGAFDTKEVPEKVWTNVSQHLFGRQQFWQPIRYWQAAAVVFFALSSFLFLQDKVGLKQQASMKEFRATEAFYIEEISEKKKMIHAVSANDLNGFTQDFQQLEAMYMVLKEEMNQKPSEKVKDALILNLIIRINLLNKQLHEVEESSRAEDEAVIS
ncbi:hypothetical protein SanaruYs_04270 [Chryseotalea sanaruensis]|uniref:Anti-sigma factor n=1 Tax=Chryseotalea sanaruensis TaxID=2482724 RepID=A0A401U5R5_9BACT|nr:hypothetical protein [Chryseotalea sanaruensis]GCC50212.1 hypothetical protein SanaruYs_04270 [Chryseotalea sanaruensis]